MILLLILLCATLSLSSSRSGTGLPLLHGATLPTTEPSSLSTRPVGKEVATLSTVDLYTSGKIRDVHREVGKYNFYHQRETKVEAKGCIQLTQQK